MKLYFLTGAGVSAESGIPTYRDAVDGLWYNHNIEDVATAQAIGRNPQKVYDFFNEMRKKMDQHEPNAAHIAIAELEKHHEVVVVTQNVDNLHERAGSTNVIHLHGNISRIRATKGGRTMEYLYDHDIKVGDKCPVLNSQLRPDVVLFGEPVPNMVPAISEMANTQALIVVGSTLYVYPAASLVDEFLDSGKLVFYIDPEPNEELSQKMFGGNHVNYIRKTATEGMKELFEILTTKK